MASKRASLRSRLAVGTAGQSCAARLAAALALAAIAVVGATSARGVQAATFQSLSPMGDAHVSQVQPNINFGFAPKLALRRLPVKRAYLRFDVPTLEGAVTRATLRLRATSSSGHGFDVRSVADTSWAEGALTYANAPPVGPVVGSARSFKPAQWISIDVTSLVAGQGPVSFALTKARGNEISVASREYGDVVAPRLEIETRGDPVVAAAGDIACDPTDPSFNGGLGTPGSCRQRYTSDLLVGADLSAVLALGDVQYECAGFSSWPQSYDPSWGRVKSLTRPVTGNHEYQTPGADCDQSGNATGYFDYFNGVGAPVGLAGDRSKGYYSFDIGSWHMIALNSNCSHVGGCGAGSPQEQWLRQDLAASSAQCTLAYWHHPLFSSGSYRPGISIVRPLFQALWDHHADVVLVGHDHNYERFAPQDANGALQPARGVRQFIVGTGGRSLVSQPTPLANSEIRHSGTFGVLELTLHPASYDWRFVPEAGKTFTDTGTQPCDAAIPDTSPPSAPANLAGSSASSRQVDLTWAAAHDNVGVVSYDIYRDGSLLTNAPPATTFSDVSVSPSNTYQYEVRARDAVGNVSPPSNSVTVTTPPPNTVAFQAEADARVEEANPSTNFATTSLRVDGGIDPDVESYLRFTVSQVFGPVQSARLRLFATNDTVDGPAVYSADSLWTETGVNWSNRPPRSNVPAGDVQAIPTDSWVEYDVTSLITGAGTYSFALATASTDGVNFSAREAGTGGPLLIVTSG